MQSINVALITGNLTRDPELRYTSDGTAVCDMRVAVNGRRKTEYEEWVDKPNYFDVTVWGKRGESCNEHLMKGRPVAIEGRLDWHEWETEGGEKRQAVRITASQVQFLGKRDSEEPAATEQPSPEGSGEGSSAEPVAVGAGREDKDDLDF
jgi:single-strand DNA-binding protein